jgi:hypothetical protein
MMIRTVLIAAALALAGAPAQAQGLDKAPPGGAYKKVSELVKLPDFLPGLGTLYVDPGTLPAGPFLAYDREGRLTSTIYMVPVEDIQGQRKFDDLKASGGAVDHVDMYYNAGHPGVEKPHYHVVLWHVAKADEARVAK